MKHIDRFDIAALEPWTIVYVWTSSEEYEMDRIIIADRAYQPGHRFIVATGGHCSCYDFNDITWDAWFLEKEELIKMARGWVKPETAGGYKSTEYQARQFVSAYFSVNLEEGGDNGSPNS